MLVLTEIHSDAFHEQLVILLVLGMYQLGRRGKEAIVSIDCQKDTYKNLVRWCHVCGVLVCSDHEIYVDNCRTGVVEMILIVGWNCVVSGSVPVECGVTGIIPDHFSGTIPVSPRDPPVYFLQRSQHHNTRQTSPMPHSAFDTLPIIDLCLAENPATKETCLEELRHALFNIGFMYIKNTGIPQVPYLNRVCG